MAKHLNHITTKVKGYLAQHDTQALKKHSQTLTTHKLTAQKQTNQKQTEQKQATQKLPTALKLAMLRGESTHRQACFHALSAKGFDDAFVYTAYQKIYQDSNAVIEFVQNSGLIKHTEDYITTGAANETADYAQLCYQLYCLLVDHLDQYGEVSLLSDVTTGVVQHYLPSFFPKQSKQKPSLDELKKTIKRGLNKHYHAQVVLKESFVSSDDEVNFKLIAHIPACYPCEVVAVTQKRMRSARFKAYHELMTLIDAEKLPKPERKTPKKKKPNTAAGLILLL